MQQKTTDKRKLTLSSFLTPYDLPSWTDRTPFETVRARRRSHHLPLLIKPSRPYLKSTGPNNAFRFGYFGLCD